MSRWVVRLVLAGLAPLLALGQMSPQNPPPAPGGLQTERPQPKTSGKQAVPPEEDKSYLTEEHSFNPLQSQKSLDTGDFYYHKGKYQAAANRYLDATMWNEGNAEAWLKLANANEKLKDRKGAREAYTKYLQIVPDAKNAAEIRKKIARRQ